MRFLVFTHLFIFFPNFTFESISKVLLFDFNYTLCEFIPRNEIFFILIFFSENININDVERVTTLMASKDFSRE